MRAAGALKRSIRRRLAKRRRQRGGSGSTRGIPSFSTSYRSAQETSRADSFGGKEWFRLRPQKLQKVQKVEKMHFSDPFIEGAPPGFHFWTPPGPGFKSPLFPESFSGKFPGRKFSGRKFSARKMPPKLRDRFFRGRLMGSRNF